MLVNRPKIVIIGAGMAGLTAAHKLYTEVGGKKSFELCVVEGGQRIGGRINTKEFMGNRIEMGATFIHGICGNPIYEMAQKTNSLKREIPWEYMEKLSFSETRTEGGFVVNSNIVEPISSLFYQLMSIPQEKSDNGDVCGTHITSIGSFLKQGLQKYWNSRMEKEGEIGEEKICGNWSKKELEESIFRVFENIQRTHTGASDLFKLDYGAESEYETFSGDEITIPKGYTSILEALTSVLPSNMIQLGKKVVKIDWLNSDNYGDQSCNTRNKPVKLHFSDGSIMEADHIIITVSLGVLKGGVNEEEFEGGLLFSPQLPSQKREAIMRLGFGVVNKLFLQLSTIEDQKGVYVDYHEIPSMKMVFHRSDSEFRDRKIPWWMRRTASLYPIYNSSSVIRGWFAGQEALELESLDDEAIIEGVSITLSNFLSKSNQSFELVNGDPKSKQSKIEFRDVERSRWGSDPLFLGSYSYVEVGSSGEDFDTLAQPLPNIEDCGSINGCPPLQILFAGEATHRTQYSTTHGAYFSGLREANRLLQHYQLFKHVTSIL